ncbi:hypothetical protein GRZ55_11475 [Chelativorans sp. ZYF759]|uniref:hypothetical protein n=1 Tax=Chelativorans sp. ZYF759 TaxID=2692213 RepID=UPI00145C5D00|nr:hypothetical protein [Chelativorans sp. ZYF759]NMG39863.1 hypothetical protein [Chelativorans sp. ZYF759]
MKRSFSRRELYDLVWTTPISTLAQQFGLSDRGLAKICQAHQIPVPGRGYWARVESGQTVNKTPLWLIENPAIETVHIGGVDPVANPRAAVAVTATKAARQRLKQEKAELQKKSTSPYQEPAPIPQRPRPLHSSLRSFAEELRTAEADREGAIDVKWVHIHRDSLPRVVSFLSALAHKLEPHGVTFSGAGSRVQFVQGSTAVDFILTSPKKRTVREQTYVGASGRSYQWKSHENVFVGRLAFQIVGRAQGVRKNWVDEDEKKVEHRIEQIVENYRIHLAVQKEQDEIDRVERERKQHLAFRRELAVKRKFREEARHRFLTSLANDRREVEDLRATIGLVPQGEDGMPEYERMLGWARERLALLIQRTTAAAVQRALLDQNLFPEPDDLHDPEGEPPEKRNYWE